MGGEVVFHIDGLPVPQGSKKAFVVGRRAVIVDDNAKLLKPWRATVAKAADLGATFDCPVSVTLDFTMMRPKKPKFQRPAVKPDIDKLTRAILDGLTDGGLLADDSRVVELHAYQFYGAPGVTVTVAEAKELDDA